MRQVKFAQRCVNVIASVRNCAIVVVNLVCQLQLHLLHALTGTSSKPGYERPEIYSRSTGWLDFMEPATAPAISRPAPRTASKRDN